MRNLMICASVVLALLLLSPLLSGGRGGGAVPHAASAGMRPVAATPADLPAEPPVEACFRRYRREAARCRTDDGMCRLRAADQWDVCEATGRWP